MIHFEMASAASGVSALTTRNANPAATTLGAAFHTSRSTGGTFLKAVKRSRQTVFCGDAEDIPLTVSK
jgi:hypothetical protein